MIDTFLVPDKTVVKGKGDGPATDLSAAGNRVFLLTLSIANIIEQESLDVSVYGSADGSVIIPCCSILPSSPKLSSCAPIGRSTAGGGAR